MTCAYALVVEEMEASCDIEDGRTLNGARWAPVCCAYCGEAHSPATVKLVTRDEELKWIYRCVRLGRVPRIRPGAALED